MGSQQPVVVYAASGYTGRLTCQSLTDLGIPFVAAGRNQARLDEVVQEMRGKGADCVARAVPHTPPGLRDLFRDAEVVINTSGPFSLLGHAVVDAALASHCHYFDTTGEQDFMLDVRRDFGSSFEREKLVLSPSTAYLWALGTAAAEACLETEGIDSLEIVYAPPSLQTVASLQSMVRVTRRPGYGLVNGDLALLPPIDMRRFTIPVTGEHRKGLRLGAGEAAFFVDDPRVRRCDTFFASNDLARAAPMFWTWNKLSKFVPGSTLDRWSDALILRLKKDPPAEEPESGRFIVTVDGEGPGRKVRALLKGTSPYIVTGFLGAMAAQDVLAGKAQRFGYASLAQVFGARHVLNRLEEVGTFMTMEPEPKDAPAAHPSPTSGA